MDLRALRHGDSYRPRPAVRDEYVNSARDREEELMKPIRAIQADVVGGIGETI